MVKHSKSPENDGQLLQLASVLIRELPRDLPTDIVQGWIQNPDGLMGGMREFLLTRQPSREELLAPWATYYKDVFGIKLDAKNVIIPERKSGLTRLLVIVGGLHYEQAWQVCQKKFNCFSCYEISDKGVPQNDRHPKDDSYAIWVRDRIEADKELKNLSAKKLTEGGTETITLLERLVFELKYFLETGEHLDIENVTLCAGSRDRGGGVPHVRFHGGRLHVRWCHPRLAGPYLRAREVVSS